MSRRVAAIDIGTNSVLLLVGERAPDGSLRALADRMEITRLGRGVDRTGVLSEEALADTLSAVRMFADEARSLGAAGVFATATSAARDAKNGHELIERAARLGVPVEIIAGAREAQLSFNAVASDFGRGGERLAVIDIGGGSTEFILGTRQGLEFRHSFDVGSVRLTERHLHADPPDPAELAALDSAVAGVLAGVPAAGQATRIVGIAGTFTTVAAISLGLAEYDGARVHGLDLPLAEVDRVATLLATLPLENRLKIEGLHPKRADVIVAGARLAAACVRALGGDRVTIGDRGVRWGYLAEKLGEA